jgi:hypothetical protein
MRLGIFAVLGALLVIAANATAGTQAFSLAVEGSSHELRPGYPDVEVTFRIAPAQSSGIQASICHNGTVSPDSRGGCATWVIWSAFFAPGATVADTRLWAGRYEAVAGASPPNRSNVVRFNITDECGWTGLHGPSSPPSGFGQPPVLAGAPYPCSGWRSGPLALRSAGGGMLDLAGIGYFDAAWDDPLIPELPPLPNLRVDLEGRRANRARIRYRAGRELRQHVIRVQTYSVLVVSRGLNDVEITQEPRLTRVRVRRGAGVLVPVTDRTRTGSFDILQHIYRRCRGKAFLPCAGAIRVKRRVNSRAEYTAKSVILRAGQTRTVRYSAP